MADTRLKRRRSDEQIVKKRDKDKERAKSRIYIGKTLEMWRELRRQKGFQSDIQLLCFCRTGKSIFLSKLMFMLTTLTKFVYDAAVVYAHWETRS
ncbi:hypothetical protein PO909_004524 [Leuciscus waleckii]